MKNNVYMVNIMRSFLIQTVSFNLYIFTRVTNKILAVYNNLKMSLR